MATRHVWERFNRVVASTTYTWDRYRTTTGYALATRSIAANRALASDYEKYGGEMVYFSGASYKIYDSSATISINSSSGVISISGTIESSGNVSYSGKTINAGKYVHIIAEYSDSSGYNSEGTEDLFFKTDNTTKLSIQDVGNLSSALYTNAAITEYYKTRATVAGTKYGTVTSTSRSAYPDDGKSGSYWYKYSGATTNYSKGTTSYGYVTSTVNTKYNTDGVTGSYWYVYKGTDTIDPTAVGYSTTTPKPGQVITITATPCANTYGGTISYLYQYSTNGGSTWTTISTTTATSINVTIPENATQFMARVRAQDNLGFTSTTYVTSANLTVKSASTIPACVNGVIYSGAIAACVDGVIHTDCNVYTCIDGIIKQAS